MMRGIHPCPLSESHSPDYASANGGVAERFNAPVLKTDVGESPPWVRIPPPPPVYIEIIDKFVKIFRLSAIAPAEEIAIRCVAVRQTVRARALELS